MALPTIINNSKLAILKARNYLNIVKIKLGAFNFTYPLIDKKYWLLFKKNVRRLKNIFKRVGCKRLKKEFFINTVINNIIFISLLAFLGLNK